MPMGTATISERTVDVVISVIVLRKRLFIILAMGWPRATDHEVPKSKRKTP